MSETILCPNINVRPTGIVSWIRYTRYSSQSYETRKVSLEHSQHLVTNIVYYMYDTATATVTLYYSSTSSLNIISLPFLLRKTPHMISPPLVLRRLSDHTAVVLLLLYARSYEISCVCGVRCGLCRVWFFFFLLWDISAFAASFLMRYQWRI